MSLNATQQTQVNTMKKEMARAQEFQMQMSLLNMKHSTQMAFAQTLKGAFDKIRA